MLKPLLLSLLLLTTLLPLLNAYAPSNGHIPIHKDSDGFYVEVDLKKHSPSDPPSNDTAKMMLSFSNSNTIVGKTDCFSFNEYFCEDFECRTYDWDPITIDFPYFSTSAQFATAPLHLDYLNWNLNTYLYLANNCYHPSFSLFGMNRTGILGMGTFNGSERNYANSEVVSIKINDDESGGLLLFSNERASDTPYFAFQVGGSWQIPLSTFNITLGEHSFGFTKYNIIFDLHTEVIGLPLEIFNTILTELRKNVFFSCSDETSRPTCYDNRPTIPNIELTVAGETILIPPEIYIQDYNSEAHIFPLNLKATSPTLTNDSYVTPNFQNSIILGSKFMKFYYTVFDRNYYSNNIIKLYQAKTGFSKLVIWIILAVIFIVVALLVKIYTDKKKKAGKPIPDLIPAEASLAYPHPVNGSDAYIPVLSNQERDDQAIQGLYPQLDAATEEQNQYVPVQQYQGQPGQLYPDLPPRQDYVPQMPAGEPLEPF